MPATNQRGLVNERRNDNCTIIAVSWIANTISCLFIVGTSIGVAFLLPRFNSISTIAKMTPQAMKIYSIFLNCLLTAVPLSITIISNIVFHYTIEHKNQEVNEDTKINKIILLVFNIISCLAVLCNCIINSVFIAGFSNAFVEAMKIKIVNLTTIIFLISNISLMCLGSFPLIFTSYIRTIIANEDDHIPPPVAPRRRIAHPPLANPPPPRPRQTVLHVIHHHRYAAPRRRPPAAAPHHPAPPQRNGGNVPPTGPHAV